MVGRALFSFYRFYIYFGSGVCMAKDLYSILGVSRDADENVLKKAYRSLAKKYHPDLHPDDAEAEAKFKEINEAFAILSDPEKRRKYDQEQQQKTNTQQSCSIIWKRLRQSCQTENRNRGFFANAKQLCSIFWIRSCYRPSCKRRKTPWTKRSEKQSAGYNRFVQPFYGIQIGHWG